MQVNLFKNQKCNYSYSKFSRQIEGRDYRLVYPVGSVRKAVDCVDSRRVDGYVRYLEKLSTEKRHYQHVGRAGSDNLFDLELLGVGQYCMRYTILFDFSDCLDYVLHRIFGCDPRDVRKLGSYEDISYAFLNYDFSRVGDVPFGVLFGLSSQLDEGFAKMQKCLGGEDGIDSMKSQFLYRFFSEVLGMLTNVKDYMVTYLNLKLSDRRFVCRSKSFSSVIVTSDKPFEEEVILHQDGFTDCIVMPRCYSMLEYAKEGVYCYDSCRGGKSFRCGVLSGSEG